MAERNHRVVVRDVADNLSEQLDAAGYTVITPRFNDLPDAAREAIRYGAYTVVAQVTSDDAFEDVRAFNDALDDYEAEPDTILHALDDASQLYEQYSSHVFDADTTVNDIVAFLDDRYTWETVRHIGDTTAEILDDAGFVPGHVTYDQFKQTLETQYENTTTARNIAGKLKRYAPDTFSDVESP